MVSMLDSLYRQGLTDAIGSADDGRMLALLDSTNEPGVYGFLTDDYTIGWQEWALRLMAMARSTAWDTVMARYFSLARRFGVNYLSVFFNVAQGFYCLGIRDYIAARGRAELALLQGRRRVRLTSAGSLRAVKPREYINVIHQLTFDYERRDRAVLESAPSEYFGRKVALKPGYYERFRRAVGLAMLPRD